MQKFIIGMLVVNQFGVLTRISGMFARRGFNIDSLTVCETEVHNISRMTVTVTGDEYTRDQTVKQLSKLHDVKEIEIINPGNSVRRELLLIKVSAENEKRQDLISVLNAFGVKIVDFAPTSMCIETTGESNKIDAFIELMKPFGIIEMCRTGLVALDRGNTCLKK